MYSDDLRIPPLPDEFDPLYARPPFAEPQPPKKSVAASVIFSMLIPGLGHLYLGLMRRGASYMVGLIVNIFLIALVENNGSGLAIEMPLTLLLSLCIPVMYFYCLFDSVHRARLLNNRRDPLYTLRELDRLPFPPPVLGAVLVLAGLLLMMTEAAPVLMNSILREYGGTIVALLLIGGGGLLLYRMK
ncbi:hypothetical protein [Gorillibacterium sp. sgz500922]|uniref:hypothetical protein n=1 Tax=Gorillibacterium sp. sgz500922 TaxID=3446694 RepID=UPI003F682180